MKFFYLVCMIMLSDAPRAVATSEVVYSLVLFRHGDRTPSLTIPSLAKDEPIWPNGFLQLTNLGMKQCFTLGEFLRRRYSILLSVEYRKDEVYIRSTDVDRAIQSAMMVSSGLYPVTDPKINWDPEIKWQPIPVHTRPQNEDPWLRPGDFDCPKLKQWRIKHTKPEWEMLLNETNTFRVFLDYMRNVTEWPDMAMTDVRYVMASLSARKVENIDYPKWMNESLWLQMKEIKGLNYKIKYDEPTVKKLSGGILLGDVLKQLWKKARNETSERLRLYSGHAGTLIPFMTLMGIFDVPSPPYAASVIVELSKVSKYEPAPAELENSKRSIPNANYLINSIPKIENNDLDSTEIGNQYFVNIFYRDNSESLDEPRGTVHPIKVPGCSEENCNLAKFAALMADKMYTKINDLRKDCEAYDKDTSS